MSVIGYCVVGLVALFVAGAVGYYWGHQDGREDAKYGPLE